MNASMGEGASGIAGTSGLTNGASDHQVCPSKRLSTSVASAGHAAPAAIQARLVRSERRAGFGHERLVALDHLHEQAGVRIAWDDRRSAFAAGQGRGRRLHRELSLGVRPFVALDAPAPPLEDGGHDPLEQVRIV
jgi:hypothetical protein